MLPTPEQVQALAQIVESHERGVIVCGPRCESGEFPQAVLALARATGYPIFADALSGLRFCDSNVIGTYDLFLSGRPALADAEVILRFGAVPTSAVLCAALAGSAAKHRIHVSASGVWADDDHSVSYLLQAEAGAVCNQLAAQCETRPKTRLTRTRWADGLRMLEQNTRLRLAGVLSDAQFFDQVAVHHLFSGLDAVSVFVGNSLAVRHVDELISAYAQLHPRDVRLYGSRGASGIDGNVSTALGIAAADPARPTIALLGDVTTYHDMNGLLAVQRLGLRNVTFVVLHNNGGGIFRRLPVAGLNQEPTFMDLFLTPHALNFELVAQLYGLQYARADSRAALQLLQWPTPRLRGTADMPPALIEIPTDSAHDLTCRNAVRKAVLEKLKSGEF
jgi:2-succinyl-5-enolpyruvyl-6-hydroxy-3-cyclohexene-1-carboxylate synthase